MHHQKEHVKVVPCTVLPFGSSLFIVNTPYAATYVTTTSLFVLIKNRLTKYCSRIHEENIHWFQSCPRLLKHCVWLKYLHMHMLCCSRFSRSFLKEFFHMVFSSVFWCTMNFSKLILKCHLTHQIRWYLCLLSTKKCHSPILGSRSAVKKNQNKTTAHQ